MNRFKRIASMAGLALMLSFPSYTLAQVTLEQSQIQLGSLSIDQLQQAAQAGDPDAQYALGYMYYYGKGVPQSNTTAINWLKRAAVQGQAQAIKAMNMLGTPVHAVPEATPLPSTASSAPVITTTVTAVSKTTTTASAASQENAAYTIQLLSTSSRKNADNYIKTKHLSGKAKIYSMKKNGKTLYVVGYGSYASSAEAKAMMKNLPAAIRAKNPFVKSMENLSS